MVDEKNNYYFSIYFSGCIPSITPIIFTINFLSASNFFDSGVFLLILPCIPFDSNNWEKND